MSVIGKFGNSAEPRNGLTGIGFAFGDAPWWLELIYRSSIES